MITNYKLYGVGKKWTNYNDYFKENILNIIEYQWIRENYNKPLDKLRELVDSSDKESRPYIRLNPILSKIEHSEIKILFDLFDEINTEDKAKKFSNKYKLEPDDLNKFLFQVQNYMLPKKAQLRQYLFTDDPKEMEYFEVLKKNKLINNLVLIETCRKRKGRKEISKKTRVPEKILLDFVNRFSVGRLPFCGGKSVKHMWNAGYRNLRDARNDTPENMTKRLLAAFKSAGLSMPNDFKKGCQDGEMIKNCQEMPEIIEY
jgi:predicted nucleic acid-binding protein